MKNFEKLVNASNKPLLTDNELEAVYTDCLNRLNRNRKSYAGKGRMTISTPCSDRTFRMVLEFVYEKRTNSFKLDLDKVSLDFESPIYN